MKIYTVFHIKFCLDEVLSDPSVDLFYSEEEAKKFAVKKYYREGIEEYFNDEEMHGILRVLSESFGFNTEKIISHENTCKALCRLFIKNYKDEDYLKAYDTAVAIHDQEPLGFLLEIQEKEVQ